MTLFRHTGRNLVSACAVMAAWVVAISCSDRSTRADIPTLTLGSPQARSSQGFTFVSSVRVLPDDRVLLVDPREASIVVFNPSLSEAHPVSRRGPGPGEWLTAGPFFAMRADTSLQADPVSRRWRVWSDTSITYTLPPDSPMAVWASLLPRGADADGHVLLSAVEDPRFTHTETGPVTPKFPAVLIDFPNASVVDTVAILADAPATIEIVGDGPPETQVRALSRGAFATGEDAVLFADGAVAVARLNPYRVDWYRLNGRDSLIGAPFGIDGTPVTDRERQAYLDRYSKTIESLKQGDPEMRRVLMRRFTDFPANIPPFGDYSLLAGGDGRLYVQRSETASDTLPRYDIVDRRSKLVGQLVLGSKGMRLVAATPSHWFIVSRDEMDLEYLEKYLNPLAR